jgi:hypothetical protein
VRCLVTGTDDQGRSCVLDESVDPEETGATGRGLGRWSLYRLAAEKRSRPGGQGQLLDITVEPDAAHWMIARWRPGGEWGPFHHTDSVDFDLVVEGSIELRLGDGDHLLVAGDCVVVTGVDHAWRAGPEGCSMSVVVIGTPPPAPSG